MSDQSTEIRQINWAECFPFTRILRTFTVAIRPGKLSLALAGIILTGFSGWVLDAIWPSSQQAVHRELDAYWQGSGIEAYRNEVRESIPRRLIGVYESMGAKAPTLDKAKEAVEDSWSSAVADARDKLASQFATRTEELDRGKKDDRKKIARIASEFNEIQAELDELAPKGVFASFRDYQLRVVRQMMDAATGLNFGGGLNEVMLARAGGTVSALLPVLEVDATGIPIRTGPDGIGVLGCVVLMLRGAQWMAFEHPLFTLLFGLDALFIWSLFGGAICRIVALNVARDERISAKAALMFSWRKLLSLAAAPLIPLVTVALIGLGIFLGGLLLLSIPVFGDLVGGAMTILSLAGGFVIALLMVGAVGGLWLMWPTIAVEGNDSFDAMSRSYSYVFSRPWRTAWYVAVGLVYTAICYLFSRFFVLIALKSTRFFLDAGVSVWNTWRPGVGSANAMKLDAIWPTPSFEVLWYPAPPFGGAVTGDGIATAIIGALTWLVAALLTALLVSMLFSASTVIYGLLRREVDATDYDEIYMEEEEQDMPPMTAGTGAPGDTGSTGQADEPDRPTPGGSSEGE